MEDIDDQHSEHDVKYGVVPYKSLRRPDDRSRGYAKKRFNKEQQRIGELTDEAEKDTLTGLLRVGAFQSRAEAAIAHSKRTGEPLTLFCTDIDNFKKDINDPYGQLTGDAVIRFVADVLTASTRETDFIGRIGGDEDAGILVNASPEFLEKFRERVSQNIKERKETLADLLPEGVDMNKILPKVGVTIGLASYDAAASHKSNPDIYKDLLSAANSEVHELKNEKNVGR